MAISRGNSLLMKKQWAEDGSTVIPNPPVAGTTYRDESVDADNIAEGQQYDGVADSARWNQLLYIITGILKDTLAHGVLPWLNTQDYSEGAVVMGSNGTLYIAEQATGPETSNSKDPITDTTSNTWKAIIRISSVKAPITVTDGSLQISVGTGLNVAENKLVLKSYKGATSSKAGELGGVPPATAADKDKFLKGDGSWDDIGSKVDALDAERLKTIGMIATFASTNLPEGWMICDGSSVLFSDWPEFQQVYNEGRFTGMTLSAADPTQKGKFVLNGSTGVYLPDLEGLYEQASSAANAGGYLAAGLPNITGAIAYLCFSGQGQTGCFTELTSQDTTLSAGGTPAETKTVELHASDSSSIFGNSNTVQPTSVQYVRAMYLGKPNAAAA